MPTFGANDRSRWATIRALVERGTFSIGERDYAADGKTFVDRGIAFEEGYTTIDMVKDPQTHRFYSSKPPLLTVLIAGEYWAIVKTLGVTLTSHRWLVVRLIVWMTNALPFALYLVGIASLGRRLLADPWSRLFLVAAAAFGTFLSTFATTLNNHTPAAVTALFAVYPLLRRGDQSWRIGDLALAGLYAGTTACFDLPAAALAAALFAAAFAVAGRQALWSFLPAMLLPVLALLVLNKLSIGQWKPAYGEFGGPWYEFEGSHWSQQKLAPPNTPIRGIDWAHTQEGRAVYAFHLLVGHHGLFSLTPLWVASVMGALMGAWQPGERGRRYRWFCLMCLAVELAVVVFFAAITSTANYGGWTSGARWFFWLTPLFLLTLPPVLDRLAPTRTGRGLLLMLFGLSALSASYPAWNPWRQPWIYNMMEGAGWPSY